MAKKVGTKTSSKSSAGRDVYKTSKGELVSEKSITLKVNDNFVNVPSIHNGVEYSEDEIYNMLMDGKIKPTSKHKTLEDAIKAAKERSDKLLNKGGAMLKKQMELFERVEGAFDEGGLMDEGGTVDPVSGNEVPIGSTQEEVRDDIPAQLSEGEFVFPADVVRYYGLETLMKMRQEAKQGLNLMEAMGQMGNSEEATIPDDIPFDINDLDMEDDGVLEYAQGGVVQAQQGTYVPPFVPTPDNQYGIAGFQTSQFAPRLIDQPVYGGPVPMPQPPIDAPMPPIQPPITPPTTTPTPVYQVPTFTQLTGTAQPEPGGYDEMRTYVNDAGMEMQIPFKNGSPIYPIPEGYKVKGEAVKTTTDVKTETTQTAPEQQDSDDPSDPFAGKQTVNLGGTVVTEATKRKEGELSGFKPGQVRGSTRYSIGSASSVTGDLSKKTTAGKEGGARVFASLKDSIAEFGRGLANQDQKTLTKEDGSMITLSEALFESIMGDRFSGKTNEVLADIFEVQSAIEQTFGDDYSKDLDNREAKKAAEQLGIEYKGQSYAEIIATNKELKDTFISARRGKQKQIVDEAMKVGQAKRNAARTLARQFGIDPTELTIAEINAAVEQKKQEALERAKSAKAARARRQQYESDDSGSDEASQQAGQAYSSTGQDRSASSGAAYSGRGIGGEFGMAKGGLAQQMKQSGLASKK